MKLSNQEYDQLLDDCDDGRHQYSFFRRYVEALHPSPRALLQAKCVERFKWEINKNEQVELDWNEAFIRWSTNGYAKAFKDIWDEYEERDVCPCCCDTYEEVCRRVKCSFE